MHRPIKYGDKIRYTVRSYCTHRSNKAVSTRGHQRQPPLIGVSVSITALMRKFEFGRVSAFTISIHGTPCAKQLTYAQMPPGATTPICQSQRRLMQMAPGHPHGHRACYVTQVYRNQYICVQRSFGSAVAAQAT